MVKVFFGGIIKEVSLEMVLQVKVDDYVFVYVGVVISVVDEVEVKKIFQYFEEMGEVEEEFNIFDFFLDKKEYMDQSWRFVKRIIVFRLKIL